MVSRLFTMGCGFLDDAGRINGPPRGQTLPSPSTGRAAPMRLPRQGHRPCPTSWQQRTSIAPPEDATERVPTEPQKFDIPSFCRAPLRRGHGLAVRRALVGAIIPNRPIDRLKSFHLPIGNPDQVGVSPTKISPSNPGIFAAEKALELRFRSLSRIGGMKDIVHLILPPVPTDGSLGRFGAIGRA